MVTRLSSLKIKQVYRDEICERDNLGLTGNIEYLQSNRIFDWKPVIIKNNASHPIPGFVHTHTHTHIKGD